MASQITGAGVPLSIGKPITTMVAPAPHALTLASRSINISIAGGFRDGVNTAPPSRSGGEWSRRRASGNVCGGGGSDGFLQEFKMAAEALANVKQGLGI